MPANKTTLQHGAWSLCQHGPPTLSPLTAQSRTIDKPSEEVTFKVKKVESGSVYMASSEELITSLNRLNNRIEQLESSFNNEIVSIRQKNDNLQKMLADVSGKLTKQQIDFAASKNQSELLNSKAPDTNQINISVLNISSNKKDAFDQSLYMSGVFAYQSEDYGSALEKFSMLNFEEIPKNTFENVLYWMADSYQHTGQYKEAFGLLNKLTRQELQNLGLIFYSYLLYYSKKH